MVSHADGIQSFFDLARHTSEGLTIGIFPDPTATATNAAAAVHSPSYAPCESQCCPDTRNHCNQRSRQRGAG